MKVYLDHGATAPVDAKVVDAMLPYFTERFGNASSLHLWGREAKNALEGSRELIAKRINARPEEFIFTSGGSESDNLALRGAAYGLMKNGRHIITSKIEHPAVRDTCRALSKSGFEVTYLNVDGEGFIDYNQLEKSIRKDTTIVSIIHANNEIGTIQDIGRIGKLCRSKGVLFHTDAVQSFTKVKIDVAAQNIDLASFSSHKIHGPKGVGGLYIRKEVQNELLKQITGGHQESNLRAGTENVAGVVGFAKAVEIAKEEYVRHMIFLRDYLIDKLLKLPDSRLNGPKGDKRLCNNVNVRFRYVEGESILLMLDTKGIAVSTGSACSSQSLEPSHVLTAIGCAPEESHGSIRFSLGRGNTKEEMDYAAESVAEVVNQLRKMSPFVK